jgi:uncharacterized protein with PIN domain
MPLQDYGLIISLVSEGIIPVTRREKFRDIEGAVFIRGDHQLEQLKELVLALSIGIDELKPFSRCSMCNAELLQRPRVAALGAVPDYIYETASDFRKCPECARVYWPGSHREKMIDKLKFTIGLDLCLGGKIGGD